MVTKERISENRIATEAESPADQINPITRQRPPIGELLKQLRGTKTLRQVEADTGITNAYLSNLELGLKKPGFRTLTKLSRYYSVPMDHLLRVADMEGDVPQPDSVDSVMDIQRAFDFVITDPNVAHYQKPADILPLDAQKFVVQIYQHYTGRKLL